MKKLVIILNIILSLLFVANTTIGQTEAPDPYQLIEAFEQKLREINDYEADLEIEVDVDFINVPVKHATIFFKQPDKIKFKSDEFIMLPKRGFNNQFGEILEDSYNALYTGTELVRGEECFLIKIIPSDKKPKVILANWWINTSNNLIMRSETNTRNEGSYTINFAYDIEGVELPSEMTISFEIEKLNLPMKFIGKMSGAEINSKEVKEGVQEGKVMLRFSNYKINQNVPDNFFDEEDATDND